MRSHLFSSLREHFPQVFHGALFEPRNLDLRNAEQMRGILLRKAAVETQSDDVSLPHRQRTDRFAQGQVFDHVFLLCAVREDLFECKALLPCLALQGFRRTDRSLGRGDVGGIEACFSGEFGNRRLSAEPLLERVARAADACRLFLDAPRDLDGPVVPQKTADLPEIFGTA